MNKISCIISNEAVQKLQQQDLEIKQQLIHNYAISPSEQLSIFLFGGIIDRAEWGFSRATNPESRLLSVDFTKVHTRPSFRMSFRTMRCVVLADSYYIWPKDKSQPERITVEEMKPILLPAVFQEINGIKQVAIITRKARTSLAHIVETEPLIFKREQIDAWLNPISSVNDTILTLSSTIPLSFTRQPTSVKIFVDGFNQKSLHNTHKEQPSLFT